MQSNDSQPSKMDPTALYHEETFTDRQMGMIKRLTPVDGDGNVDASRPVIYQGETQIMLGNNPLPINFDMDVDSLGKAAELFADAAQQAAADTMKKLEDMRRDMQSQIVVPGQGGGMGGGGGGKIQLS